MSKRSRVFALIGLVILIAACGQIEPSPLFLPTNTSVPATPTSSPSPPTSLLASDAPTVGSPTPTTVQVEPTRTSPSPTLEKAFPPVIALEPWLSDFENPVYLIYASDVPPWDSRVFVVEKVGRILAVENGQVLPVPFLDIVDRVGSKGSEQGLLSVAFPPDFASSEVFYVNYTDQRGNTVVSRYQLLERDPPQGDPTSEQKILKIAQPANNHNGGQLQFGADGYLYIGTGDGGRAGDPWGNAQDPGALLGKMLRIDVEGGNPYRIPSDNPFLDWSDVRSEIWALGLRNPWRFSFDRVTGDLYIADVGQNSYEEINFQPTHSTGGQNYGWNIMEGGHCFSPARDCDSAGLIVPVAEYDHKLGCSVTGGYVYRGARYPKMTGVYVFGDFCSGRIWGLRRSASSEWDTALLLESGVAIGSFGQDAGGELYVLDYRDGTIYRLIASR